jgi:uncharacterized protein YqjF (DUF2071 family)
MVPGTMARQRRTLDELGHRPWPLPDGPWVQGQTWCDLLFAHWRVPADRLRRVMPPALPLHLYDDGSAWLGITPFVVKGLRLRGTPPLPWVSHFPELNVRTYVEIDGRPGIYFFSLDAGRRAAVIAARRLYRLPYFHARMRADRVGARRDYECERIDSSAWRAGWPSAIPHTSSTGTDDRCGSTSTTRPGRSSPPRVSWRRRRWRTRSASGSRVIRYFTSAPDRTR